MGYRLDRLLNVDDNNINRCQVEISETLIYRIDDGGYLPKNPTYEAKHPMPTDLTGWDNDALLVDSPPAPLCGLNPKR
jgi:hypothetical protein